MIEITVDEPGRSSWNTTTEDAALFGLKSGAFLGHGPIVGRHQFGSLIEPGANITIAAPGVLVFGSKKHRQELEWRCIRGTFGGYAD